MAPKTTLKTAILRPNSSFDRDAFLDWTPAWLSRNATADEIGFAFAIDLKNPEQVLSIIFSPEVMAQLDIPADMQVIDVTTAIATGVTNVVRRTMGDDIAAAIETAKLNTPPTAAITDDQFAELVNKIEAAITVEAPSEEQVKAWAHEGTALQLASMQRQINDLTRFVMQMQAGGAVMPPLTSIPQNLAPAAPILSNAPQLAILPPPAGDPVRTILPPNATPAERALERVIAARLIGLEDPIYTIWNVDTCPEHILPWMAWSFSVETWDPDWNTPIKREVIRNSLAIHRIKGTKQSIQMALATLGLNLELREWFELDDAGQPYGPPHTFALLAHTAQVLAAGHQTDGKLAATINRLINHVKPARAHFHMRYATKARATLQIATTSATRVRHSAKLAPRIPPVQAATTLQIATTAATRTRHSAKLAPRIPPVQAATTLQIATTATTRARHTARLAPRIPPVQAATTLQIATTARVRTRTSSRLEITL